MAVAGWAKNCRFFSLSLNVNLPLTGMFGHLVTLDVNPELKKL